MRPACDRHFVAHDPAPRPTHLGMQTFATLQDLVAGFDARLDAPDGIERSFRVLHARRRRSTQTVARDAAPTQRLQVFR